LRRRRRSPVGLEGDARFGDQGHRIGAGAAPGPLHQPLERGAGVGAPPNRAVAAEPGVEEDARQGPWPDPKLIGLALQGGVIGLVEANADLSSSRLPV